ncbi:MAG: hypothetical protein KC777_27945 [Cyanobacteria bacterium HKST-UBA02]|nr:hypothetical protein [Cyanobacteria bacterium HKST-UBA02]
MKSKRQSKARKDRKFEELNHIETLNQAKSKQLEACAGAFGWGGYIFKAKGGNGGAGGHAGLLGN